MPLLGPADYSAIRALLDMALDTDSLPDEKIELSVFIGKAELWIAEQTLNTDEHAKLATRYYTAALLRPSLPMILSETAPGFSYSRDKSSWPTQEELFALAQEEVALSEKNNPTITDADDVSGDIPITFDVADAGFWVG